MSAARVMSGTSRAAAGGGAVFAAAAAWSGASALAADRPSAATTWLILGSGLALAACWAAASRRPSVVAAGVVGAAIGILLADPAATFRYGPRQGPFGYANATAAFVVQACIAALLLAVVARGVLRLVGGIAAAGFGLSLLATRSWAAAIALPVAVLLALGVEQARGGRAAVAACAGLFVVAVLGTVLIGAWGRGGPFDRTLDATIGEERAALWHDALVVTADHPLLGVGPGGFETASATAVSDEDLRWAHNEFLQSGAETGLPGYALVVGLFLWGFVALGAGQAGRAAALSAAGLAGLGLQASVDYVLHFPVVALAGAAVVGIGLGAGWHERRELAALVPVEPAGGTA